MRGFATILQIQKCQVFHPNIDIKLSTHRVLVLEIGSGKSRSSVLNNRDIVTFWAFMFLHHTHAGLKSIFFAEVKQVLQKDTLRLCSRLQLFLTLNLRWYVHQAYLLQSEVTLNHSELDCHIDTLMVPQLYSHFLLCCSL